jgi:hypothetical protein
VGRAADNSTFPWAEAVAASPASVVAAGCVSAPVAGSVVRAFVLSAAASRHWRVVARGAGVPVPASAAVVGVADSASGLACLAVADISGPVSGFPCSEPGRVGVVEAPQRGSAGEEHCSPRALRSPDEQLVRCRDSPAEERYSPGDPLHFRRVRLEDDMARPLLWLARLRGP